MPYNITNAVMGLCVGDVLGVTVEFMHGSNHQTILSNALPIITSA